MLKCLEVDMTKKKLWDFNVTVTEKKFIYFVISKLKLLKAWNYNRW